MARTPEQPLATEKSRLRRAALIDAARRAFVERGYVETSVSDIIRLAGGSRASFYSYFNSKDDLLAILVDELTEDLFVAATEPLDRASSPFDGLVATIGQFMTAYRDRASMLLVLDQATAVNQAFTDRRLAIRARFASRLEATLGQRNGRRPDADGLDPGLTAVALGGMVEDMARGRYLFGQEFDDELAVRTLAVLWARALGMRTD